MLTDEKLVLMVTQEAESDESVRTYCNEALTWLIWTHPIVNTSKQPRSLLPEDLRFREVTSLAQGHTFRKAQSRHSHTSVPDLETTSMSLTADTGPGSAFRQ